MRLGSLSLQTPRLVLVALFVLVGLNACRDADTASSPQVEQASGAVEEGTSNSAPDRAATYAPTFGFNRGGSEANSGEAAFLAQNSAREGQEIVDDEEGKEEKYWSGIEFGRDQFEEIIEYVNQEYIEEKIDASRAYVSASSFALSLLDPPYDIVPEAYYKSHKEDPVLEIKGADRDEMNRQRRDWYRQRSDEIQAEWKKVKFGRNNFLDVMAFAEKEGTASKKKKVSKSRLWLSAAQGFLYALDPHSSLVSKAAWEESTKETQDASFDGIGALLTQRFEPSGTVENRLKGKTRRIGKEDSYLLVEIKDEDKLQRKTYVESPMPGQPAEKAGLWAGDEIIKVDSKPTVDLPLDKVVSMIRGPRGTTVVLTVRREGVPGDLDLPVTRAHIKVTNVEGRMVDHHPCIGYVKLTGFIETSYTELRSEIERLSDECRDGSGLRGLVFDMRNNSGGLLTQGVKIADLFLSSGKIVTVKNRRKSIFAFLGDGGDEVYTATRKDTVTVPLVVLVNDGSASASEIVASALQDNGRALIVGERTFGKASVQTLISPLRGKGYYVKLTIARYYAPSGRTLQVVGVQPDVEAAPEFGANPPLGFREEDLSNHLPKIEAEYASANLPRMEGLRQCVERRGIAEKVFRSDPHPQIKFDYQLYAAADYLECAIQDEEMRARAGQDGPDDVNLP